jgi:hypothetical protein
MKKQFILIIVLALTINVFSQLNPNRTAAIKTDYLQKSKKQKKAAWVLLCGGATFTL